MPQPPTRSSAMVSGGRRWAPRPRTSTTTSTRSGWTGRRRGSEGRSSRCARPLPPILDLVAWPQVSGRGRVGCPGQFLFLGGGKLSCKISRPRCRARPVSRGVAMWKWSWALTIPNYTQPSKICEFGGPWAKTHAFPRNVAIRYLCNGVGSRVIQLSPCRGRRDPELVALYT